MEFDSSRSSREDGERVKDERMSLRGLWLRGFAESLAQFGHHFFSVSGQLFHLLHASTYYSDISNSSEENLEYYLRSSDLLFSNG
jgi:hypothetical protein